MRQRGRYSFGLLMVLPALVLLVLWELGKFAARRRLAG